ncbi:MAG: DUF4230 domain-containing protein [Prevotella sp.]|nr:DUF4230 domain-containing protein [Prevotella sp.]
MKNKKGIVETFSQLQRLAILAILLGAVLLGVWFCHEMKGSHVEMGANEAIDITPTQIQSIEAIGEWEFLSISNEELVDTVRKGLFRNDELVRIYYGTIRLGINMRQAKPHWLTVEGDTIKAVLPKVGLLDRDFIDEARTKAFFESGSWSAKDREAMYRKAYRQMLRRCLTPANLKTAQDNAEAQFSKMLRAMGYKVVVIRFED